MDDAPERKEPRDMLSDDSLRVKRLLKKPARLVRPCLSCGRCV